MNGYRYRISTIQRVLTLDDEALSAIIKSDTGEVINYFMNPSAHGNLTLTETTGGMLTELALDDKYGVGVGVIAKNHAVVDPTNPGGPKVPAYVTKVQQAKVQTVAYLDAWNPIQNAYDTYWVRVSDSVETAADAAAELLADPDFVAVLHGAQTVQTLLTGFDMIGGLRGEASGYDGEFGLTEMQGDVNLAIRGNFGQGVAYSPYKKAWRVTLDNVGWAAKRGASILLAPNKMAWALPPAVYNELAPVINYYGSSSEFRLVFQGEQLYAQKADGNGYSMPVRVGDLLVRMADNDGRVESEFQYGIERPRGMPTGPYGKQVLTYQEDGETVTTILSDAYTI